MRIMPPHSSERSLRAMPHPHRMPNINPASDKANDTNPMMPIGGRMDAKLQTPRKANETPTAKASMLVATANAATTFSELVPAIFILERFHNHTSTQKS